jgi:hypothetical protein
VAGVSFADLCRTTTVHAPLPPDRYHFVTITPPDFASYSSNAAYTGEP